MRCRRPDSEHACLEPPDWRELPGWRLPAPNAYRQDSATHRRGFTLVELLVVMGVLGILSGVAFAAVSSAKRSSKDLICLNNLRQIGMATQTYHQDKGYFPPGGIEPRVGRNVTNRQLAWSAFLLPYLDQQVVYRGLDLSKPFDAPENAQAASVVIEVYTCPLSERTTLRPEGRGACDYGGIYGERITSPNSPPKGVMLYNRSVSHPEIIDGLSNTLMISEDNRWHEGQWINGRNVMDQAFGINRAPAFENDIWSHHRGGANGLFCDGRACFLSEEIDLKVLAAICTRAGREKIDETMFIRGR